MRALASTSFGAAYQPPTDEELTQVHAPAKPGRGRFSGMTVAELQAKYLEVGGRPTGSDNTAYLA